MSNEQQLCELCGEPMPRGEEMFKYHGYSGPCPSSPLSRSSVKAGAFAERLDALPRVPERPIQHETNLEPYRTNKILWHIAGERDALEARLRLAMELLEDVLNESVVVQSLRQYEEWQISPGMRPDIRALVAKIKGELA